MLNDFYETKALSFPTVPAVLVSLRQRHEKILENARAKSTRRVYDVHWKHFERWCAARSIVPLPAQPGAIVLYLEDCASEVSVSTLGARLAAITERHARSGEKPTADPAIKEVMKALRRMYGRAAKPKEPILTEDIAAMLEAQSETLAGLRNKALLLLGYTGAFRRSELAALMVEDLKFTRDGLTITIRHSKTDQESQGQLIAIPYLKGSKYCPVLTIRGWLDAADLKKGPVLRPFSRSGRVLTRCLSCEAIAQIVKKAALSIGKDPTIFAGHSLRSGFATQVAMNGGTVSDIMRQTRHKSVDAALKYIRIGQLYDRNPSTMLGL